MSCRTTVCLGTLRSCDGLQINVETDGLTGRALGASVGGSVLLADNIVPCAVPSKMSAHLHAAIVAHVSTSSGPASFYVLGRTVTETRCGDLMASQLVEGLLVKDGRRSVAEMASECMLFGTDDDFVTCETLTSSDSPAAIDRVLRRIRNVTLVAFRFSRCVCLVIMSTQLSTAHIASLIASTSEASIASIYLYLGEDMTGMEMRTACAELEAVKATASEFTTPITGAHVCGHTPLCSRPCVGAAPPSVSRVLNTTVSDDGRRDGSVYLDAPPPLRGTQADRGASDAFLEREVQWLKEELARAQEDRDAAEMERRACQGVLQSYRERFSEMGTRDVALLHAISGGHREDSAANRHREEQLIKQLRQDVADANRARDAAEERMRLIELRGEMTANKSATAPAPTAASHEELAALRRENLDLAALLQQKDQASHAAIDALRLQLAEAEAAKQDMEEALLLQSQTIKEAKEAVLAERARHSAELREALDAVKTLSRDNSRTGTSPLRSSVPVRSPSQSKPPSGRQRRYASPRGSVDMSSVVAQNHREERSHNGFSVPAPLTSPPR